MASSKSLSNLPSTGLLTDQSGHSVCHSQRLPRVIASTPTTAMESAPMLPSSLLENDPPAHRRLLPPRPARRPPTACQYEFEFSRGPRVECERWIHEHARFMTQMLLMLKRQANSLYTRGYLVQLYHYRPSIQTTSLKRSYASRHQRQRQSGG